MGRYRLIEINDPRAWDELVGLCPYSTPFNSWEWRRALSERFVGMRPRYLAVEADGETVAAIPILIFSPFPGLKSALSMPWNLFGGPLLRGDMCDRSDLLRFSMNAMEEVSRQSGAYELVVTRPPLSPSGVKAELERWADHVEGRFTHLLRLVPDFERIWRAYNPRVRTAVRKAQRLGVKPVRTKSEGKLREFYAIYLDAMTRFGSPPKPYELLRWVQTSPIGDLIVAEIEGKVVAGLLFLTFGKTITLWCGASLREFRSYRPNNLIFNEVIKWGCRSGYEWVDFGASPPENQGLVAFKEEWRAVRYDFEIYHKIFSPARKKIWEKLEPSLRRIYSRIQTIKRSHYPN
jgi:CelD/BcsL family acetyltransferase involved in cellulose biosynthesis